MDLQYFIYWRCCWKPGLDINNVASKLNQKYKADLVIVNAENASDGKGCTETEGKILFNLGAHVLTGGNHTWDKHQSQEYLKTDKRVLRPLNYPKGHMETVILL